MNVHLVGPKGLSSISSYQISFDENCRIGNRGKKKSLMYLKETFPRISNSKNKEGIFVGQHIRELIIDDNFGERLIDLGKRAWSSFKNITTKCLGNT